MSSPESRNIEDAYPLSPLQEGMLFHVLHQPETGTYLDQFSMLLEVGHELEEEVFRDAVDRVVERHGALRTAFVWKGRKRPLQVVLRGVRLPWSSADWRDVPEPRQSARWRDVLAADRASGFDPAVAPLARIFLARLTERTWRCLVTYHHLLMDAWSLPLVIGEILTFYRELRAGRRIDPPKPRPFRDYIAWLRSRNPKETEAYWRSRLRGLTAPTPLGVDRPAPVRDDGEASGASAYERRSIVLTDDATRALEALAGRWKLTLSNLVTAAWALVLSRYAGQRDVVFGFTLSGRPEGLRGVERMIGLFINTLPIRIEVPPEARLGDWLARVHERQLELAEVQHTPLVDAHGWSGVPRSLPLFESMLVFENAPARGRSVGEGSDLWLHSGEYAPQTHYPLSLMAIPGPQLTFRAFSRSERLDGTAVKRLLRHLERVLEAIGRGGMPRLRELPLLTRAEHHQILREWNDTAGPIDGQARIEDRIIEGARRHPDRIAVAADGADLSFRELVRRTDRLARRLRGLGVRRGERVGVHLPRSPEMVVAILGVLRAGAAYVPLDVAWPQARMAWIVERMEIRHVLTEPSLREGLEAVAAEEADRRILAEAEGEDDLSGGSVEPSGNLSSDDVAYTIFTSGSTGRPKGVVVRHRAAVQLIDWVNETFRVGAGDRILFVTSLGFDLSVYDVFGLLAAGGTVRVVSDAELEDPARLVELLHGDRITFWDSAPAALQRLVPWFGAAAPAAGSALRLVFLSGDWVPINLPGRVEEEFPGVEVVALGGATEATVWSNFHRVREIAPDAVSVPYGRPIRGARYHVLDEEDGFAPMPIGVAGGLFIGGECLADGYDRAPVQTAERFVPDGVGTAFPGRSGERLYRTGDRARYLPNGELEFLGRADQQVKIRGFRVELEEIEATLLRHPGVRHAAVVARGDGRSGDKTLAAFIVPKPGEVPTAEALRTHLGEGLPAYMVPPMFTFLEALPVTANGKLDRAALTAWAAEGPAETSEAPRSSWELRLATLWADLFEVESVGVHDDFLALGGHSLLAVRMVAEIQSRFGRELSLRAVLAAPTVARQARLLEGGGAAAWSPLVALQSRGERPPLFCVHSGGGGVLRYAVLGRHLGAEQPLYGLEARGLEPGTEPLDSIDDMAALYLEALAERAPDGPVHLAGWSFGGFVAYEMACRLREAGRSVDLLALLDTGVPRDWGDRDDLDLLHDVVGERLPPELLGELAVLDGIDAQIERLVERARDLELLPDDFEVARARRMFEVHRRNYDAVPRHAFRPYAGELRLVRTARTAELRGDDPTLGWGELVQGGVEVTDVSGSHTTLLDPPHDREVAAALRAWLDRQLERRVVQPAP